MTSAVDTTLEPPPLDLLTTTQDEDEPAIHLHLSITEPDGTTRTASIALLATATDAVLSDALVRVITGCASMRGPGLVRAVERRLR